MNIEKLKRSRFAQVGFLIIGILLVVNLARSVYDLWRKKDIVSVREDKLKTLTEENERLKQELELVQSPEFIEQQAREKLGLAQEGEVVVIVEKDVESEADGNIIHEDSINSGDGPNWKKWWTLFN